MKTVTKNNLLKLVELKKQYEKTRNTKTLQQINNYIENVINKDKKYFTKLSSYNFDNETLKYLIY